MTEDWILGFVWGIGTIAENRLSIRFKDIALLESIADTLHTKARPFHPTEGKNNLRFMVTHPFVKKLLAFGWSGRFDKGREYPFGDFDELEFMKGYCYTKSNVDIINGKNGSGKPIRFLRLRIWGSLDIVTNIDSFLAHYFNMEPKKPQICKGKTDYGEGSCYAIYYQSKKYVPEILKLLNLKGDLSND